MHASRRRCARTLFPLSSSVSSPNCACSRANVASLGRRLRLRSVAWGNPPPCSLFHTETRLGSTDSKACVDVDACGCDNVYARRHAIATRLHGRGYTSDVSFAIRDCSAIEATINDRVVRKVDEHSECLEDSFLRRLERLAPSRSLVTCRDAPMIITELERVVVG